MKTIIVFLVLCFISMAVSKFLMEGECSQPSDCGPGECCLLGMQRYAIPQCQPLGKIGEYCMEGAEPQDRMLYYPNNEIKWVEQLHTLMCPCHSTLICQSNRCTEP